MLVLSARIKSAIPTKAQARDFWREHHHRMVYIAIFCIVFASIVHLNVRADVGSTNLYAGDCMGAWQHAERASGAPDVALGATDFSPANSAVVTGNPSQIVCSNFTGNVPDGVVPKKFVVHLSWIATDEPIADPNNLVQDDAVSTPALVPIPDASTSSVDTTSPVASSTSSTTSSDDSIVLPDSSSSTTSTIVSTDTSSTTASSSSVDTASSSSTDSQPVQQNSPVMTTDIPTEDFLQLKYTLDGVTWQNLGTVNASNYKNISFEINSTESGTDMLKWGNLAHFQISVATLLSDDKLPNIYLDSVYVEANYESIPKISDPPKISLKDSSVVLDGKADFGSDETPTFVVTDPGFTTSDIQTLVDTNQAEVLKDTRGIIAVPETNDAIDTATSTLNVIKENVIDPVINNVEQNIQNTTDTVTSFLSPSIAQAMSDSATITDAQVVDAVGAATDIPVVISDVVIDGVHKQQISITKPARAFRPGKYTLKLSLNTAQAIIVSEQDFTWGVLTINTDKSIYHSGDEAFLQMGAINDIGHTICDADMSLVITSPDGNTYPFASANNTINQSGECHGDSYVTTPDYSANFTIPSQEGVYKMVLTATTDNGTRSIVSHFAVENTPLFDVVRTGPTRIYPVSAYPVSFKITSPTDWTGTITEKLPSSFDVNPASYSQNYSSVATSSDGESKIISWNVSLDAGVQKTIGYYFNAPEISPQFYLLGPLSFYDAGQDTTNDTPIFAESRQWQIADDAVCTAVKSGTWNTTNTNSMWTGCSGTNNTPGAADDVTINATDASSTAITITLGAATPAVNSLTIAGTLDTSSTSNFALNSKTISISTTGILNANNSNITLSGTAAGTLMSVTGSGVFNSGGSTVTLTGSGSNTINSAGFTGSNAFNNLTENITGVTKTLGANLDVKSTASVLLGTFDTSTSSSFALKAGKVSIAGSASAIFNANASTITLTATSGTLFTVTTNGVFNYGTSTVVMNPDAAIQPFSGTAMTFYNLTFSPVLTTTRIYTIQNDSIAKGVNGNFTINPSGTGNLDVLVGAPVTVASTGTTLITGTGGATSTYDTSFVARTLTTGLLDVESAGTLIGGTANQIIVNGTTNGILKILGTYTSNTSTITVTGGSTATTIPALSTYYSLTVNNASNTYLLTGTTTLNSAGTLSVQNGTFDTSSSTSYALNAGHITVSSSGLFNANASTITLTGTTGNLIGSAVATDFNAGSSTIIANGNASVNFISGAGAFTNVAFNNVTFSPTLTTGVGNITYNFDPNNVSHTVTGTLLISPLGTPSSSVTLTVAMSSMIIGSTILTKDASANSNTLSKIDLSVNNRSFTTSSLDIESVGTLVGQSNSQSIVINGTGNNVFQNNGGTFTSNNCTVNITGGGATTTIPAFTYYNLTLNNASDKYFLTGTTTVSVATALSGGTFDTSSSGNYSLISGAVSTASGTILNANNSVITLTATSGTLFSIGAGGTFNQGGSEVVVTSASGNPTIVGAANVTFHKLTINAPNATVINQGSSGIVFDNAVGANFHIKAGVYNDMSQSISTTSGGGNATLQIDGASSGTAGTLCLGGTAVASTNSTCNSSATSVLTRAVPTFGTYTFDNSSAVMSTVIILANATLSGASIPSSVTYGNLKITPVLTTAQTYTAQGALNVNGNLTFAPTGTSTALTFNLAGAVTVASGQTLSLTPTTATVNLDTTASGCSSASCAITAGNIDIESGGTITGRSATITDNGNWTNNGTFTQGTSTVVLKSGTTATVSGTVTFYNLSITPTVAKEVDFVTATSSAPVYNVTNVFTSTGQSGLLVTLRETGAVAGTQWKFHPTGTASVVYTDVKDGGCQAGSITIIPTSDVNSGNNGLCWGFNSYITFSVSSASVGFGALSSTNARYSTANGTGSSTDVEGNNITVSSFAAGGYSLSVMGSSLSYMSHTISPIGNSNLASNVGFEQFGLRAIATGGLGVVQSPYSGSGFAFPSNANTVPSVIATESSANSNGVQTVYSIHYIANIASNTPAGKYSTNLTYLLTGTF